MLTLLLLFSAGLLFYIFLVHNFIYWKNRGVPNPVPRPLLGNLPNLILQKRNFQYDIIDIYREYSGKERFVGIINIRKPQLLITDPKLVQDILIAKFKNFSDNELSKMVDKDVDPLFGRNPLILSADEWKEKRAELTPALTSNRIKISYPIISSVCSQMTKYIEKLKENSPTGIDTKELAARFTTEVVANCVYGTEAGAFKDKHCELRKMGASILDQSVVSLIYLTLITMLPDFFRKLYKRPLVKREVADYFTGLMYEAIKIRGKTKSNRMDFLNYLLQLQDKKGLSDFEIAAHGMTFFSEGHETSSVLISNCLRCLAENEDIQQRLRDNINDIVHKNREITFDQLMDMPYLDQCINETLRIYPPVISMTKVCTDTCQLTNNRGKGFQIDKGIPVILPYYAIHHDPEYYDRPDDFIPERFSHVQGGIKTYKERGVFFPFGDGPRICLGMKFGLCQSKAAVADIIRNWKITLNPRTKKDFILDPSNFFCMPEGGNWLDFERVEN